MAKKGARHIAYFDVHVDRNVPFGPVLAFQKKFEPTEIIIGGDFLNLEYASHWNEIAFKHIGYNTIGDKLQAEFDEGYALLQQIRNASPNARIRYIPGNHEAWLYWVAMCHPQAGIGLVNKRPGRRHTDFGSDLAVESQVQIKLILEKKLNTAVLEIEVLPYRHQLQIGKIKYIHGDEFASIASTARIYPNDNLVFGHWHTHDVKTLHNGGEFGRAIQHVAVPCLTDLGPGYLKTRSTRWLKGFWIADIAASGLFDGRVKKLLNGKTIP